MDYPGHYLRLIKRVRMSVIALAPPNVELKATLATTGPSRVVVGGPVFSEVPVVLPPQTVAFSRYIGASGTFELDLQPEMLLPFEGMGVASGWAFTMPHAANPIDYGTIADVLVTVEYTALHDGTYREQVVQRLDRTVSADRAFSFRHEFSDAWYDLHNPELTDTPMTVTFETRREDFPPNVGNLTIRQLKLYFARREGPAGQTSGVGEVKNRTARVHTG